MNMMHPLSKSRGGVEKLVVPLRVMNVHSRATSVAGEVPAPNGQATLSRWDSSSSLTRGSTTIAHEMAAVTPFASIGRFDSSTTLPPRRLSFDQVAASIYAQVNVGTHDSTRNLGWDVRRTGSTNAPASVPGNVAMRQRDPVSARLGPRSHDSEYTRALAGVRARDGSRGTAQVERVVADLLQCQQRRLAVAHADRPRRSDPLRTRDATRTLTIVQRTIDSVRRLMDDTTTFKQSSHARGGWTRQAPVSMHALSESDVVDGRSGPETVSHTAFPVWGDVARRWGDDGTLSMSHTPPPISFVTVNSLLPPTDDGGRTAMRSGDAPPMRAGATNVVRPPHAVVQRQGKRSEMI